MAHSKMAPKRKVNVRGQKHSLAYINDREKRLLRQAGGSGKPGPSGIPTYYDEGDDYSGPNPRSDADTGANFGTTPGDDSGAQSFGDGNDQANRVAAARNALDRSRTAERNRAAAAKAKAKSELNKARAELNKRVEDRDRYSKDMNNNFIMRTFASLNKVGAERIRDRLNEDDKAIPVRGPRGEVVGVISNGAYTGTTLDRADYKGPKEYANLTVTQDQGKDQPEITMSNTRVGAREDKPLEIIDGEVNMPDAPSSGEGGDATDSAKKLSKMGKESTISTTSQGLLGSGRTRNRSLMSGLIS